MKSEMIFFDIFIRGDLVNLVVLTEEIVEKTNWYKWFNDEDNTKYMQKHYFPNTKTMQLEYFKNDIENNTEKMQLGIVHKKDNVMIGTLSLNSIDLLNRTAEISIIIGEKKYRELNYFLQSCKLMIKHGFETIGLNRIYSGTISKDIDNLFCKLLGFRSEGILKKSVYKNGNFSDVFLCAILKENKCD
jgi:[ribosomal protein S5]-alanine N-acetyltransferase